MRIARFDICQVFYVEFLHPGIHTFSGVCSIQRSFTAASAGGRHLDFCPPRHYLRPPRGQLLRITRWRRECAGLMGRLAVSVHQESPRSASIWARTRIFPNSKHGKIFFSANELGETVKDQDPSLRVANGYVLFCLRTGSKLNFAQHFLGGWKEYASH